MNFKTRAVSRRRTSYQEPSVHWRERLRKSVAIVALSALALAGLSAMAAAPASADEAPPVVCLEPQVLDEATQECVDPPVGDEAAGAGLTCDAPSVLNGAGDACLEQPAELVCGDGMVLNEAGDACLEQPAELVCGDGMVLNDAGDACVELPTDSRSDTDGPPVGDPGQTLSSADIEVNQNGPAKIQFCHRTASASNPYVYLDTSIQAFFNSGHISHVGPIFPLTGDGGFWGDIYPPNQYDEDGQNWNAEGIAIFENDCNIPGTPPTTPGLHISVEECVLYEGRDVVVEATHLQADKFYQLFLGATLKDSGMGDTAIAFSTVLDAGSYSVTVKMFADDKAKDKDLISTLTVDFFVEECGDLGLEVTPDSCSLGDDGAASVYLTGLIAGEDYSWYVSGAGGYYDEGTFEATDDTETVTLADLPPDHYFAYVEWVAGGANILVPKKPEVWAQDWFTVDPCEPDITVTVAECTAMGGTGSALISLTNLVDGIEYDVWVTAQGDEFGPTFGSVQTVVGDADGKAHVNVASLPAPGQYTAWVEGEFMWPHGVVSRTAIVDDWFEPVILKDHVDFALKACPPTLPQTGVDPMQALTMSMLLSGAGALVLVAGRLRRILG